MFFSLEWMEDNVIFKKEMEQGNQRDVASRKGSCFVHWTDPGKIPDTPYATLSPARSNSWAQVHK